MNFADKEIINLKRAIEKINKISNEDLIELLNERKLKELEFHDRDRDTKLIENLSNDEYNKLYGNKNIIQFRRDLKNICLIG